jgi:hypothetical protein
VALASEHDGTTGKMNLLFRILHAAHAKGTHHKLALDALRHLANRDGEAWARVFLKHADLYLAGAKAPDDEFKDFKNHVLHVRDGYWGGAPEKALNWYGHLVEALTHRDWPRASYAAGVLSHYYADPLMPFHTAQSEAENNIHRAAEWSISRSYDSLRADGERAHGRLVVTMPPGPHWLKELVVEGAEKANAGYEKLIAHYDINSGVVDPPSGLDRFARALVAELLMHATKGMALIIDRAIADSGTAAPDVTLGSEAILAALKVPLRLLQKRLADAADRRQVEAMYDELRATGRVEKTLPEDDRAVRDLFRREVLAPREAARAAERARRLPSASAQAPPPAPRAAVALPPPAVAADHRAQAEPQPPARRSSLLARRLAAAGAPAPASPGVAQPPTTRPIPGELSAAERPSRTHLSMSDAVEAAPSIGPRMAEALATIGLATVADLMAADPKTAAMKLGDRRITSRTVQDWQDQARLMMTVPGLRGGHAQLLVAAGYRSVEQIRTADAARLSADLLATASTAEGQRILRDGAAPDIERIRTWIESAAVARAA